MQSQDFDIIATRAVNGDVVFVQDQLTCARDPASSAMPGWGCSLVTASCNSSTKLLARVGLSLAMNPAISSMGPSAVLVHLMAMDQVLYLANIALTCRSVANSPASAFLMPS